MAASLMTGPATSGIPRLSYAGPFCCALSPTQPATPRWHPVVVFERAFGDELGQPHRLEPGDSYLIKQVNSSFWQVAGSRVQKPFFNVVEPRSIVPALARGRTDGERWRDPSVAAVGTRSAPAADSSPWAHHHPRIDR